MSATAQAPATQPSAAPRIIGEVTAVNRAAKTLTIKTQAGDFTVHLDETGNCKRVAPDAKTLEGAESIEFTDIRTGDRVWARSAVAASADNVTSVNSKQLVLMSAASIAERRQRDMESWQRRGLQGEITAIGTDAKEFTVKLRDGNLVTMTLGEKAEVRQYPQGSTDFNAAKVVPASALKVGDSMFARGERSADGRTFTAEMVVAGDVPRPTFGAIKAVNPEKGEIVVRMRDTETTIKVTGETMLRRMSDDMMARMQSGGPGGGQPGAQGRPMEQRQGGGAMQGPPPQGGAPAGATGQGGGPGRGPMMMRMGGAGGFGNPQQWMEQIKQSPEIKLTDLKAGDFVIANGPKSVDGSTVQAIFVMRIVIPTMPAGGPSLGSPGMGTGDVTPPPSF